MKPAGGGCEKITAPSNCEMALQVARMQPQSSPVYSKRTWSKRLVSRGTPPNHRPCQSPGAGASAAEVNTMGFSGVPTAITAPEAANSPLQCSTRIPLWRSKASVTPGSMVSVVRGLLAPPPITNLSTVELPMCQRTPRSRITVFSCSFSSWFTRISSLRLPV